MKNHRVDARIKHSLLLKSQKMMKKKEKIEVNETAHVGIEPGSSCQKELENYYDISNKNLPPTTKVTHNKIITNQEESQQMICAEMKRPNQVMGDKHNLNNLIITLTEDTMKSQIRV